jgi:hypothetical protein
MLTSHVKDKEVMGYELPRRIREGQQVKYKGSEDKHVMGYILPRLMRRQEGISSGQSCKP